MMFMIPIPPTSRLIAATAPVTTLKTRCVRSRWRRISRGTTTSGAAPGRPAHERLGDARRGADALALASRNTISSTPSGWRSPPRSSAGSGTITARFRSRARIGRPSRARDGALLERAHHPVPISPEPHALAERALEREERARHRRPEHRHALPVRDVEVGQEAPGGELEPRGLA